jgi:hypothetical protein
MWEGIDDNKKAAVEKKPSVATVEHQRVLTTASRIRPLAVFWSLPKPNPEPVVVPELPTSFAAQEKRYCAWRQLYQTY